VRIHVIGFGNLYQGDDGFGPHVCRHLRVEPLPAGVRVHDAGTSGLHALALFEDCELAIVVDAIGGRTPGSVRRLAPSDALPPARGMSTHELGANHLLEVLPLALDEVPEIVIFGAEVAAVQPFTDELSPPLRRAAVRVAQLVRQEIGGRLRVAPHIGRTHAG